MQNPERDPVLSSAERIGQHRLYVVDSALERLAHVVPTVEAVPAPAPVQKYPEGVVGMNLREQADAATAHQNSLEQSRAEINEVFKDAA